jgi:hypothetical protein
VDSIEFWKFVVEVDEGEINIAHANTNAIMILDTYEIELYINKKMWLR